jgi:hypothetical protein
MSGGSLDYVSFKIDDAVDEIQEALRVGCFSEETKERFREAVVLLREASVYAHRIEWLFSGDDNEESFHSRLEEELNELEEDK